MSDHAINLGILCLTVLAVLLTLLTAIDPAIRLIRRLQKWMGNKPMPPQEQIRRTRWVSLPFNLVVTALLILLSWKALRDEPITGFAPGWPDAISCATLELPYEADWAKSIYYHKETASRSGHGHVLIYTMTGLFNTKLPQIPLEGMLSQGYLPHEIWIDSASKQIIDPRFDTSKADDFRMIYKKAFVGYPNCAVTDAKIGALSKDQNLLDKIEIKTSLKEIKDSGNAFLFARMTL